jgi:hypothetical protein
VHTAVPDGDAGPDRLSDAAVGVRAGRQPDRAPSTQRNNNIKQLKALNGSATRPS